MKKFFLLNLILVFISSWALPALADELEDALNQKNNIANQIDSLSKQKQSLQNELNNTKNNKESIANTKAKEESEYKQKISEINRLNEEIKQLEKAAKESGDNYNKQLELLKNRLKVMYKNTNTTYLQILIESKNISDFFDRLELLMQVSKMDRQLMESFDIAKKDYETKKKLVEDKRDETQKKADENKKNIEKLTASISRADEQIRKLNSDLSRLEWQIDSLNEQSAMINDLIKTLQNKSKAYAGGSMVWPAPGYGGISSYYGNRYHPILKKYKMHTGIDINAPYGASIVAANKGVVIFAGWQDGYGNTVIIDHGGGIATLYAHTSKILVSTGSSVEAGTVIARVGSTGLSTGPHLHFEVIKDGATTDPLSYVSP